MVNLIPTPKKHTVQNEALHVIPSAVYTDVAAFGEALATFSKSVSKIYDIEMTLSPEAGIVLVLDPTLSRNAYALESECGIIIRASSVEGAHYGLATALQLLEKKGDALAVPSVSIEDYPDKDYRAFMIATGRIFHPVKKMLKYIDLCYFYKVKYLHWHLADSLLYSVPSKAFPKICKEGKCYSYEDIKTIRTYAADRGILIVPEVECPGHTTVLTDAYPEVFACFSDKERTRVVDPLQFEHGAAGVVCVGSERSVEGIKTLIREIIELFPDAPYIHLGGDEAPFGTWDACVECQKYMKEQGIASSKELYAEYVGRMASYVLSLGKTPMVWEGFAKEYNHYIPRETVVIAWEARYQLAQELLDSGFKIINASWKPLYIVTRYLTQYAHYTYEDILSWNIYNWQNWHPKSYATLNPVNIAPTDDLMGATLCAWSMQYEQLISRLLQNMPAFSERTWSLERRQDLPTYQRTFGEVGDKAAKLITDIE